MNSLLLTEETIKTELWVTRLKKLFYKLSQMSKELAACWIPQRKNNK
jgi:hypothetical protein